MSQKNKQIISHALIIVFAFYYVNACFLYHSHIINGVTIVHSHFHNKAHTQIGTHSDSELTLISALSVFQSLEVSLFFAGLGVFLLLLTTIQIISEKRFASTTIIYHSLRAPPSLILK